MTAIPDLAGPLTAALVRVRAQAGMAIASDVPADVAVSLEGDGIAITGRALSLRAATDPRLRDFAGIAKASIGSAGR